MSPLDGVDQPPGRAAGAGAHNGPVAPALGAAPSWYDVTWNPTAGCSPAGPGCEHCEAVRTLAQLARMGGKGGARYAGLTTPERSGPQWTGEVRMHDDVLTWPLLQRKGRRIFVNSLADLFHEKLPMATLDAVHAVMAMAPRHRFLVLTRRAGRMREYFTDPETRDRIAAQIARLAATMPLGPGSGPRARANNNGANGAAAGEPGNLAAEELRAASANPQNEGPGPAGAATMAWPLPNLWLGVSVEDQDHAGRIGELLQTPAALRWAGFEPLLGPVRLDLVPLADHGYVNALFGNRFDVDGRGRQVAIGGASMRSLDWVIAGGETGTGARPTDPDWVRDLRDRCTAAGVPFFFKHWGEWAPEPADGSEQKMVRRGRRTAGRVIDGRVWDELPAAMRQRTRRSR